MFLLFFISLPNTIVNQSIYLNGFLLQSCHNPYVPKLVIRKPLNENDGARGNPTEHRPAPDFTEKVWDACNHTVGAKLGLEPGRSSLPTLHSEGRSLGLQLYLLWIKPNSVSPSLHSTSTSVFKKKKKTLISCPLISNLTQVSPALWFGEHFMVSFLYYNQNTRPTVKWLVRHEQQGNKRLEALPRDHPKTTLLAVR